MKVRGIDYKGMFTLFVKYTNISEEIASSIFEYDCAYPSSLNLNGQDFTSAPETRSHQRQSYLSADSTCENTHLLAYVAKVQTHDTDNTTYSDIIECEDDERKIWESAMIKELKSLRDLGSFKMMSRPRASNVI